MLLVLPFRHFCYWLMISPLLITLVLLIMAPSCCHALSGPLYPKLSTCFEGARLTQLVQLVTAGRLFLGHKGLVDL